MEKKKSFINEEREVVQHSRGTSTSTKLERNFFFPEKFLHFGRNPSFFFCIEIWRKKKRKKIFSSFLGTNYRNNRN